jgi:hypothetical protein
MTSTDQQVDVRVVHSSDEHAVALLCRRARSVAGRLRDAIRRNAVETYLAVRNLVSRKSVLGGGISTVTLTTHGARVTGSALAIESIARGAVRPRRMILWIDDRATLNALPAAVRRLARRGLEVRLSDRNYGPHTKYYPYVRLPDSSASPFVTADDDVVYPKYWLERLESAFLRQPDLVHCFRAHRIQFDGLAVAPYSNWIEASGRRAEASDAGPSLLNFATGVSGVIYPPLAGEALAAAGDAFLTSCATADDVWIHVQLVRSGIRTHQIDATPRLFHLMQRAQADGLWTTMNGTANDEYIRTHYSGEVLSRLLGVAGLTSPRAERG